MAIVLSRGCHWSGPPAGFKDAIKEQLKRIVCSLPSISPKDDGRDYKPNFNFVHAHPIISLWP